MIMRYIPSSIIRISRIFLMLPLGIMLLSACTAPDKECLTGDVSGTDLRKLTLEAITPGWVSTNIKARKDKVLTITTSGSIGLCKPCKEDACPSDMTQAPTGAFKDVLSTGTPVDTGLYVRSGDMVTLMVAPPSGDSGALGNKWTTYKGDDAPDSWKGDSSDKICSSVSSSGSKNCWIAKGLGLIAFMDTATASYTPFTDSSVSLANSYKTVEHTGKLYLAIKDYCTDADCYTENSGGYQVNVQVLACPATNGMPATNYAGGGQLEVKIASSSDNGGSYNSETGLYEKFLTLTDGQYDGKAPASGNVLVRIKDTDYTDNYGAYNMTLESEVPESEGISNLVNDKIIKPIADEVQKASHTMFVNMVADSQYIKAVRAMLVLYIVVYAVMFLFGMVQLSQMDLVLRLLRIAVIIALISPNSWEFFNGYVFTLFREGSLELIQLTTAAFNSNTNSDIMSVSNPFSFIDRTIGIFIAEETWLKLSALLLIFPIGWIYIIMIAYSMSVYIAGVIKAIIGYLMAIVVMGLLISLAPVYIAFLFFGVTKTFFEKWLNHLFRYAMEPMLMILTLVVVNEFVVIALYGVLNYSACWKCALPFTIPIPGDNDIQLLCFNYYVPWGYDADGSGLNFFKQFPFMFVSIIMLWIFTDFAQKCSMFVSRTAAGLTSTSAILGTNIFSHGVDNSRQTKSNVRGKAENLSGQPQLAERVQASAANKLRSFVGMNKDVKDGAGNVISEGGIGRRERKDAAESMGALQKDLTNTGGGEATPSDNSTTRKTVTEKPKPQPSGGGSDGDSNDGD